MTRTEPPKPHDLVMVTDTGMRIPIDLRPLRYEPETHTQHWTPVIEADLDAVMPAVIAFDGPPVGVGHAVSFEQPGPGWDTLEWAQRVMANSRHVFAYYDNSDGDVLR